MNLFRGGFRSDEFRSKSTTILLIKNKKLLRAISVTPKICGFRISLPKAQCVPIRDWTTEVAFQFSTRLEATRFSDSGLGIPGSSRVCSRLLEIIGWKLPAQKGFGGLSFLLGCLFFSVSPTSDVPSSGLHRHTTAPAFAWYGGLVLPCKSVH